MIWKALLLSVLLATAIVAFAYSLMKRIRVLKLAGPSFRIDRFGERFRELIVVGFLQKTVLRELLPGIMHVLIFFGFLVLLFRTVSLVVLGYSPAAFHWLMGNPVGHLYLVIKEIFEILVLVGVAIAFYRRLIERPPRLTFSVQALLILAMIAALMVSDFLFDGAEFALWGGGHIGSTTHAGFLAGAWAWSPVGAWLGGSMSGVPVRGLEAISNVFFFLHITLVLVFLNYLPYGKHFHVITALPNVFLKELKPKGQLRHVPDMEKIIEADGVIGVNRVEGYPWKDVMDLYTCTECGRCQDACPAWATKKPLSPKKLAMAQRDHLYAKQEFLLSGDKDKKWSGPELISEAVVSKDVIWSCVSCRNCEEVCPVDIQYVQRIVDMRRYLATMENDYPKELISTFRGMENNGNPWGLPKQERAAWASGLDVPLASESKDFDVLYWVGCAASYDNRSRQTAKAFVKILKAAGVKFAILGPEESCTGDSARRLGNEYLFQMLAQQNIETLNGYSVKKIVTGCPHCFNTLANEYPQMGGQYEVVHSSVFVRDLVAQGKLKLARTVAQDVVYHDPCYLGRFNDRYDEPRELLSKTVSGPVLEAGRTRSNSFCCGAGGGRMWVEEHEPRVSTARLDQLLKTNPKTVAVACPFCMNMMVDAAKTRGVEEKIAVKDVIELVADALA
jgi:Fe-S oxidoreductase